MFKCSTSNGNGCGCTFSGRTIMELRYNLAQCAAEQAEKKLEDIRRQLAKYKAAGK